jgi:nicotinamidase-related amidase
MLLENVGAKNVVLMGINTNTCVLNTGFTAFNKNYRVVVLSECVASMYGDDLHVLGLQNFARCLGWVLDNTTFKQKIEQARKLNVA